MSTSDGPQNPGDGSHSEHTSVSLSIRLFTTGLYVGYAPLAPGTVGSLLGILIFSIPGFEQPYVIIPVIAVSFFLGVHGASKMEQLHGRDPRIVVIDEIVGMWVSLALLPKHPGVAALAFFTFRLLDIVKPYPARKSETLGSGWGVMIDDVIVGIYTNLLVRLILFFYQM